MNRSTGVTDQGLYYSHESVDPCHTDGRMRPNNLLVIDRSSSLAWSMVKESQQGSTMTVGELEVSMSSYCKASLPGRCVLTASSDDFDAVLRFQWMEPGTWTAQDAATTLRTLRSLK